MQCQHVLQDGGRCKAPSLHGQVHCYFHHTELSEDRHAARVRGGRARRTPTLPHDTPGHTVEIRSRHRRPA